MGVLGILIFCRGELNYRIYLEGILILFRKFNRFIINKIIILFFRKYFGEFFVCGYLYKCIGRF